jgi:hypothetical protein
MEDVRFTGSAKVHLSPEEMAELAAKIAAAM